METKCENCGVKGEFV